MKFKKRLVVEMPAFLHRLLKEDAALRGTTITALVLRMVYKRYVTDSRLRAVFDEE